MIDFFVSVDCFLAREIMNRYFINENYIDEDMKFFNKIYN